MQKLRKSIIKLTGYWIYKKKHLTTGVDFLIDIENFYSRDYLNINTILDIGANTGQSANKFATTFKSSNIYSFEPEKQTFNKLNQNTRTLKKVQTFNKGVGAEVGTLTLHHGKYSAWNSFVTDLNDTGKSSEVEVTTIDHFIKEHKLDHIDILKTDTEGFDIKVLEGGKNMLSLGKIKFIYIESGFYDDNLRNSNLFQIMKFLRAYDFYLFGIYEVGKGGSHMVNGNALFVHSSVAKS